MITCLAWVKRGAAKAVPDKVSELFISLSVVYTFIASDKAVSKLMCSLERETGVDPHLKYMILEKLQNTQPP